MRNSARWFVPVGVVTALGAGSLISSAAAGSPPDVPTLTAQEVLAKAAAAEVPGLSGTVTTKADLGLPSLDTISGSPHSGTDDAAGMMTGLLTGKTEMRVARAGSEQASVSVLDPFSEFTIVRDGQTVWTYASRPNQATKMTLPARRASQSDPGKGVSPGLGELAELTPDQLAAQTLQAVDASTEVTVGTPEYVAGRASYPLTLTPRGTQTLVGSVEIAVDAATGAALRWQVFPRGATSPALAAGFTSVDFTAPAASTFQFTPPPGAEVSEQALPTKKAEAPATASPRPQVSGEGWDSVVELQLGERAASELLSGGLSGEGAGEQAALLSQLITPVAGGAAISTNLGSLLVTADGRLLLGAVPTAALVSAAE